MNFFGKVLITFGLCSLFFALVLTWQRNNPNRVAFTNTEVLASNTDHNPLRLIINSQDINQQIIEGKVENYKWEVTDRGVSRIGNVYYGHNWSNLLGNLTKVKPNDIVEIKYSDNSVKKYKVTITQEVSPDQKDILNLANKNTILIYTCSGFMDSKRFIVVGDLM